MDDELKDVLGKLVAKIDAEAAESARFREEVRSELRVIGARIDGIDKRLDDQGRMIAALIPTRIAAVPPAAE